MGRGKLDVNNMGARGAYMSYHVMYCLFSYLFQRRWCMYVYVCVCVYDLSVDLGHSLGF